MQCALYSVHLSVYLLVFDTAGLTSQRLFQASSRSSYNSRNASLISRPRYLILTINNFVSVISLSLPLSLSISVSWSVIVVCFVLIFIYHF
jgi:hypothetical protein